MLMPRGESVGIVKLNLSNFDGVISHVAFQDSCDVVVKWNYHTDKYIMSLEFSI